LIAIADFYFLNLHKITKFPTILQQVTADMNRDQQIKGLAKLGQFINAFLNRRMIIKMMRFD